MTLAVLVGLDDFPFFVGFAVLFPMAFSDTPAFLLDAVFFSMLLFGVVFRVVMLFLAAAALATFGAAAFIFAEGFRVALFAVVLAPFVPIRLLYPFP